MKTGIFVFIVTLVILVATAFGLVRIARAQSTGTMCGKTERILQVISGYGEQGVLEGLTGNIRVQIFSNPKTGDWTSISRYPNGTACITGAGTDLQPMTRAVKPKGGEL